MVEVTQQQLWEKAYKEIKVKNAQDFILPELPTWNYSPCQHHDEPRVDCEYRECGGEPFGYQKVSAAYNLVARKSLLTSVPGSGKSIVLALVAALIKESEKTLRAIFVVPTVSVAQWEKELHRWVPGLKTRAIFKGTKKEDRINTYADYQNWEILLVGYHGFSLDIEYIENIPINFLATDDVDPLHKTSNKTHKAIVAMAENTKWVVVANATPTQTHLLNLFAATVPIGAPLVWGGKTQFEKRYVRRSPVYIPTNRRDQNGNRKVQKTMPVTGYQNMEELTDKYNRMHIRYTYDQIAGEVRMPDIMSTDVPLELHPLQQSWMQKLEEGILTLKDNIKGQNLGQQKFAALKVFTRANQICAGLQSLGEDDVPGKTSSKIDWIMNNIDSSFEDNKVVIYAIHRGTIAAIQERLKKAGIGYATIDGKTKDKKAEQDRFWQDDDCRVMLLSAAGERSLNLQCADVLIMLDSQYNPARVQQIAGRLRRAGSKHSKIHVFRLFCEGTQEERVAKVLSARQAVADAVNQEEDDSALFQKLSADEILRLIRP